MPDHADWAGRQRKTRLGVALVAEVAGDYPDGVFFVPLAYGNHDNVTL